MSFVINKLFLRKTSTPSPLNASKQINRFPTLVCFIFFFKTEQPSSSSLSTTTSSVTSMTSLEHESNDTSVSASDYGNDMASDYGLNDGWDVAGDMDVRINQCNVTSDKNLTINLYTFQTSQDPSSPLAAMPSTSLPLASTTSNLSAQRNTDPRDEWSWNDWGSLEEQPVSVKIYFESLFS